MRLSIVSTAICLSFVGLSTASEAEAAIRRATHIPAQGLGPALQVLAKDHDFQVLYRTEIVGELRTSGAVGELTATEALTQLLSGTGLTYRYLDEDTVTIVPLSVSSSDVATSAVPVGTQSSSATVEEGQQLERKRGFFERFRIAQVDQGKVSASASVGQSDASARKDEKRIELEEIVVTGSRLKGRVEGATPVTTFGQEKIEQLGVTNVADVLNYLPQRSLSFSDNTNFAGAQSIQLRGLGLGTTLVLINGRRTVSSALQSARAFFDVNNIPLPAVERIEILSNSASAVYGADAVAGVVNIILKDEIERPVVDLYYGFTPEGDSDEKRASLSFGLSPGRLRSGITLDYFERTPLFGSERDITANQDFTRFGGADARSPNANPGNVFSTTAAPLPGLTSTFAGVPAGSTGVGLTPADFQATAGIRNLESTGRYGSIIPDAQRLSAVAFAQFDLTDSATIFSEFMYTDREDNRLFAPPSLSNALVTAANPFNPFGVPVRVSYLLTGIGPRDDTSESESYRAVAGIKGDLGSWNWEVSALITDDEGSSRPPLALDQQRVAAGLAATDPAAALNPFQDGPGGSAELLRSLIAPRVIDRFSSDAKQVSAFVSGPVFDLPGGAVEVVIGGEARTEEVDLNAFGFVLAADRETQAAFGEVRVPLIAPDMDVRLAERFAVTAAARYDHYDDFGSTFNPQFGLEWSFDRHLMVRASYGTSFRPPTLFELYQPETFTSGIDTIIDPRRNNERYVVDLRSGGNSGLEPEDAKAFSAGLVINPQWLDGLRFSVDYWRIEQDLRVQRFSPTIVVNNESTFPDRVIRGEPTAQDIAAGIPGRILQVNATSANFGGVEADGLDMKADFRIETGFGTFQPSLSATYMNGFDASTLPGQPAIERAGLAGSIVVGGSLPKWKATGELAWGLRSLQLSATGRYIGSYDGVDFFDVRTGRKVDSQFIVGVQAGFTFGEGIGPSSDLDGLSIRVGAMNLFNQEPPFAQVSTTQGFDSSQADLRQRFLYIKLSKPF